MLSSEMAKNFNIVHSQFKLIVKEHNDMVDKLNNNFNEIIENFRKFGILDVERDQERNNEFYRLITRNQEIRGNLYMNGDIHLQGKLITDNNQETSNKVDDAFLNSFTNEFNNKINSIKESLNSLTTMHTTLNNDLSKTNEKISGINTNSSSNIISLVYTPSNIEELIDNTIGIQWEEQDVSKPFSIILYDFSFFPSLEITGNITADSKKLKIDLTKNEENNKTIAQITKQTGNFARIDGFVVNTNQTIITSTVFS